MFSEKLTKLFETKIMFKKIVNWLILMSPQVVKKSESIWPEGLKDRIKLASEGRNWGGVAGQKIVPKYLDYFIYGNVIILCEGLLSPSQMLVLCNETNC